MVASRATAAIGDFMGDPSPMGSVTGETIACLVRKTPESFRGFVLFFRIVPDVVGR